MQKSAVAAHAEKAAHKQVRGAGPRPPADALARIHLPHARAWSQPRGLWGQVKMAVAEQSTHAQAAGKSRLMQLWSI